jgi:hypothetical protein
MANDLPAKYTGIRDLQTKFLIQDMHADYYLVNYPFQFKKKKSQSLTNKVLSRGVLGSDLENTGLRAKVVKIEKLSGRTRFRNLSCETKRW